MFSAVPRFAKIAAVVILAAASSVATFDAADARRAGSSGFGSRGTRTFDTPAITRTAPTQAAPIDRTMTQRPPQQTTTQPPLGAPQRPGLFGGFGGRYVAETLMPLILDLAREYEKAKEDPEFLKELALRAAESRLCCE